VADRQRPVRVLHVEDDPLDRDLVAETLRQQGLPCDIIAVETRDVFAQALDSDGFDVILADDRLPPVRRSIRAGARH
jgi:CheY-like chemotaxis protein